MRAAALTMNAFDPEAYLDAAAAALELPIPPESRAAVVANLVRLHALAQEVLACEIPEVAPLGPDLLAPSREKNGPE
jgi:hypothetical protein